MSNLQLTGRSRANVKFSDLKIGDWFEFLTTVEPWIKVAHTYNCKEFPFMNCVSLRTGFGGIVFDSDPIRAIVYAKEL